ncbi:hypothetical protein KSF78_0001924 [Schistosoma japonicum]|nr:hypothetical protein KSF78_0001924 [Schistosoma japonicum]KAH8855182.1 hypothetical protein KSF78_0001924 [Schistosoma japonicum]KAH8855183.1 hypothetical protein KSF78_0001924 [Schistosoma japonicum]KAH8855184.1 hypothetical protein KSF78_0001924 [Schistosoma japonicum]KAH8855185.1 hypothetical protein KSF78_0001924 [Schistosoma japonicum]
MKSKSKRAPSETDLHKPRFDQIFLIIHVDAAKRFLNNLTNVNQLKLEIQTHLEASNLVLQRPNLSLNSLLKTDLFKQQYHLEPMRLINNNPKEMEPLTSLWDSALINYFLECIKWSTTKWIEEFYKRNLNIVSNNEHISMFQCLPNINDYNEMDVEKLLCIITSFTTAYLLLHHLQLWQLTNGNLFPNTTESNVNDNLIKEIKTTCLMASIRFFKSLFQSSPVYSAAKSINAHGDKTVESNLVDFQNQFTGYLSILTPTAAELFIEYFSKHFLNKHNLLERVFGPYTARNQKLIRIPCPLYFDTLLETYETADSIWPAPLSEAIPLKFISNYPQLFPEKVTKWLKIIKPIESLKDSEQQQQQQQEQEQKEQSASSDNEVQITSTIDKIKQKEELDSIFYEKYLTSIDTLDSMELNAIIQVNPLELDNIVQKLFTDSSLTLANEDYMKRIKEKQVELGRRLIERAKIKITEKNNYIK